MNRLAAVALIALVAACESGAPTGLPSGVPRGAIEIVMQPVGGEWALRLLTGRSSGYIMTRQRLLLRDSATWSALWSSMVVHFRPTPPLPEVDFTTDAVVVAAQGAHEGSGHRIEIQGAYLHNDRLYVLVHETAPTSTCGIFPLQVTPVHAVRVPTRVATVTFIESASTECGDARH